MRTRNQRSAGFLAVLPLFMLLSLLSGCAFGKPETASPPEGQVSSKNSTPAKKAVPRALTIGKDTTNQGRQECMGTLDYIDALMLGDILYFGYHSGEDDKELPAEAIGEQLDTVAYTMSDDACKDFVMQSRDATFLPAGTPIYKLRDYDPSFRVYAEGRIFEVAENPNAKTIGDLYDIEGKVKSLDRVSGNDGSLMWSYDPEDTKAFVSDLLKLKYVGFDAIYTNNPPEYKTSLRLRLKDGTSLRLAYWPKANALTTGAYGTKRMLEIVQKKR